MNCKVSVFLYLRSNISHMRKVIYFFLLIFSSSIYSQENSPSLNFYKSEFGLKLKQLESNPSFSNVQSLDSKSLFIINDYSPQIPKIPVYNSYNIFIKDNFTGNYILYNIANENFREIQSFTNFYEFGSTSNTQPFNQGVSAADFGSYILTSLANQYKFKLKEGCK